VIRSTCPYCGEMIVFDSLKAGEKWLNSGRPCARAVCPGLPDSIQLPLPLPLAWQRYVATRDV
jgi:hypothetical protein